MLQDTSLPTFPFSDIIVTIRQEAAHCVVRQQKNNWAFQTEIPHTTIYIMYGSRPLSSGRLNTRLLQTSKLISYKKGIGVIFYPMHSPLGLLQANINENINKAKLAAGNCSDWERKHSFWYNTTCTWWLCHRGCKAIKLWLELATISRKPFKDLDLDVFQWRQILGNAMNFKGSLWKLPDFFFPNNTQRHHRQS